VNRWLAGSSLGARFGDLLEEGGERRHVAFGFEEEVEGLSQGEIYTC
jgi:hypothetical protein